MDWICIPLAEGAIFDFQLLTSQLLVVIFWYTFSICGITKANALYKWISFPIFIHIRGIFDIKSLCLTKWKWNDILCCYFMGVCVSCETLWLMTEVNWQKTEEFECVKMRSTISCVRVCVCARSIHFSINILRLWFTGVFLHFHLWLFVLYTKHFAILIITIIVIITSSSSHSSISYRIFGPFISVNIQLIPWIGMCMYGSTGVRVQPHEYK